VEGTEQPLHDDYVYAVRDEEAYLQADDEKPPIPKEPFPSILCQFCGKTFEAKRRVRDPNTSALAAVWICNECVVQMARLLTEEPPGPQWLRRWRQWTPGGLMRP